MKTEKDILLDLYSCYSKMAVHYHKVAKESIEDKDTYWFNMGMASVAEIAKTKVFEAFENNYPEES